jgi:hypothetical protein
VLTSLDLAGWTLPGAVDARLGCGRSEAERTMRPVGVVVLHVDAQDPFKMSSVCDQEPIETVTADRADPAFGEGVRVRRPKRGADDLDVFATEDIVEGEAELAVAVVDQEPERTLSLRERPDKLPGLLGCPTPIRVGAATGEVDAACVEFDEEEHVQATEPERLDGEEITRDHRLGVRTKELAPVELGASAGRRDAGLTEDLGDVVAETR